MRRPNSADITVAVALVLLSAMLCGLVYQAEVIERQRTMVALLWDDLMATRRACR